tara:strand:+ start:939 stop:1250 length:312 start_codon:yes stop_codon:yes gene_type:complete
MGSKAKRQATQREKARLEDMRDVMATSQGQRVIWEIMDMCGVSRKNMNVESVAIARQEGLRAAGLDVQTWATMAAPNHMMQMIQEHGEKLGLLANDEDEEDEA